MPHRLQRDVNTGKVDRVVARQLDRLGRTAKGLTALFRARGRGARQPEGRPRFGHPRRAPDSANVLASVAQYETEIRAECVLAGQAKAKAESKSWGGSKPGRLLTVTQEQVAAILRMCDEGTPKAKIARATGVSRPTVYRVLERRGEDQIQPQ